MDIWCNGTTNTHNQVDNNSLSAGMGDMFEMHEVLETIMFVPNSQFIRLNICISLLVFRSACQRETEDDGAEVSGR